MRAGTREGTAGHGRAPVLAGVAAAALWATTAHGQLEPPFVPPNLPSSWTCTETPDEILDGGTSGLRVLEHPSDGSGPHLGLKEHTLDGRYFELELIAALVERGHSSSVCRSILVLREDDGPGHFVGASVGECSFGSGEHADNPHIKFGEQNTGHDGQLLCQRGWIRVDYDGTDFDENRGLRFSIPGAFIFRRFGHEGNACPTAPLAVPPDGCTDAITNGRNVPVPAVKETAPPAPEPLTAKPGDGQVTLNWGLPAEKTGNDDYVVIDHYELRGKPTDQLAQMPFTDDEWADIPGTNHYTVEHKVEGLDNGTAYTIELRAVVLKAGEDGADGPGEAATVEAEPVSSDTGLGGLDIQTMPPTDGTVTLVQRSCAAGDCGFDPTVRQYEASVAHSVTFLTVTPTARNDGQRITVQGAGVGSGDPSAQIAVGNVPITIVVAVTAQDGKSQGNYLLTVTRDDPAALSGLEIAYQTGPAPEDRHTVTLTPAFTSSGLLYTASVGNTVAAVTVEPTPNPTTQTVTVNGTKVFNRTPPEGMDTHEPVRPERVGLNLGPNEITIVASDAASGNTAYDVTLNRAKSDNADLSDLAVAPGTLSPPFARGVTSYSVAVGKDVTSVTVTATPADPNSEVAIDPEPATGGGVELQPGGNVVTVRVTAQSGAVKTYTLNVERASTASVNLSKLGISPGTLRPAFDPTVNRYAASVADSVEELEIIPTAAAPDDVTIEINGTSVDSCNPDTSSCDPHTESLDDGDTVIAITVTPTAAGQASRTYTLTVTRRPPGTDLSALTVSAGTKAVDLKPPFNASKFEYEGDVDGTVEEVTITPSASEPEGARITVAGQSVSSGKGVPVSLEPGSNTFRIVVSKDGTASTYIVRIRRGSAVDLGALTVAPGTLSPAFDPGVSSYLASVDHTDARVLVTPIAAVPATTTITVAGTPVPEGGGVVVELDVGENVIPVVVESADGTTKTYTLRVTRGEDATLKSLAFTPAVTLAPAFAGQTTTYSGRVANDVDRVTVRPVASDSGATVQVDGVPAGTGGVVVNLAVGDNRIAIVVTRGVSRNTYTVTLTRAGTADLSRLVFEPDISLAPPFSAATEEYVGTVDADLKALRVTATPASDVATMTVNGSTARSGVQTTVTLADGANVIEIVVTDQDGSARKTYRITVARRSAAPVFAGQVAPQKAQVGTYFEMQLPPAAGGDGTLAYTLAPGLPRGLAFDPATRTIAGTPTQAATARVFTLTATDRDRDSATLAFILEVAADSVPTFGSSAVDRQQAQVGRALELQLPAARGGDGAITYTLDPALPDGLVFDAATLLVSGTPTERPAEVQYTLTATDEDGDTAQLVFFLEVLRDKTPSFGDVSLEPQRLRVHTPFQLILPMATGGDGELTYSLAPALPAGLSFLAAARTVSGTPTEATDETLYTLTVTDEDGDADEVVFLLQVVDTVPGFGDASVDPQRLRVGSPFELSLPRATGGDGELAYSLVPALPAGLSFSPVWLTVSGTPTGAAAETTYTLTATDEDDDTGTLEFLLEVTPDSKPHFRGITLGGQRLRVGSPVELALPEAIGGDAPVTYSLAPDPPAGLVFDAVTRTLSGTPDETMDPIVYTLLASDEDSDRGALRFVVEVLPDSMPTFGDDAAIAAQRLEVGEPVELTLPRATGGDGAITYAIAPALPDGLRFDAAARLLSGAASRVTGEAIYTYSATDEDGDRATLQFPLEVDNIPSFGDAAVPPLLYHVGTPIADLNLPAAQGGDGRLTYTLDPALPEGLRFDPGRRRLSGTPAEEMPRTRYTLAATDGDGDRATLGLTLRVGPAITISIADAAAAEGRPLELPLTLSAAAQVPLTVAYRTADGTATAGEDYVAVAGRTVTFAPGETTTVARIQVFADDVPEFDETVTVTLSDAPHAQLGAAQATATITDDDTERVRDTALRVSMAAFGRMLMGDAVEVIGNRFMEGPPTKSRTTLNGWQLAPVAGGLGATAAGGRGGGSGGAARPGRHGHTRGAGPGPSTRIVPRVGEGAFVLNLSGSAAGNGSPWTLWGKGSIGRFTGRPEGLDLEGDVEAAYLGVDAQLRDDLRVGLAVSRGGGEMRYGQADAFDGTVSLAMTTLLPYAHWTLRDGMDLWAMIGAGQGTAKLEDELADAERDLGMFAAAAGGRNELLVWQGIDIAAKADVMTLTMGGDDRENALETNAFAGRVRALLEARSELWWSDGSGLGAGVEVGGRWDVGDAGSAFGAELGAGLMYRQRALGLGVDIRGRALLARGGEPREHGASLAVELDPGMIGTGFRFRLEPVWGSPASRAEALWRGNVPLAERSAARDRGRTLGAEFGYGFARRDGAKPVDLAARLFEYPTGEMGYRLGGASTGVRAGWRWEVERRETPGDRPRHAFIVEWRLRPRTP